MVVSLDFVPHLEENVIYDVDESKRRRSMDLLEKAVLDFNLAWTKPSLLAAARL